jgi:hypothetical protein
MVWRRKEYWAEHTDSSTGSRGWFHISHSDPDCGFLLYKTQLDGTPDGKPLSEFPRLRDAKARAEQIIHPPYPPERPHPHKLPGAPMLPAPSPVDNRYDRPLAQRLADPTFTPGRTEWPSEQQAQQVLDVLAQQGYTVFHKGPVDRFCSAKLD